jgi:hypothetical protein
MRLDSMLKINRHTILGSIMNTARRVYVTIFEETYAGLHFGHLSPVHLEIDNRCDS